MNILRFLIITLLISSCANKTPVVIDKKEYFVVQILSEQEFDLEGTFSDIFDLKEVLTNLITESKKSKILIMGYEESQMHGLLNISNALYGTAYEVYLTNDSGAISKVDFQ